MFAAFGVFTKDGIHSKGELVQIVVDYVEKASVDRIKNLVAEAANLNIAQSEIAV